MAYASTSDLIISGLPATALGSLTPAQQAAALEDASQEIDTYLRGRFPLPLLAWGADIRKATCVIAAYNAMGVRGYNPQAGADVIILTRYEQTIEWLRDVQRRAAHPNVTVTEPATEYEQPLVITSSAVGGGFTERNRGW